METKIILLNTPLALFPLHPADHGCMKRLFINFVTKMSYFISQEVENPVQIMKYDELSRF